MFGWLRNHCNLISLVICLIILSLLSREFYRIIDFFITFRAPINPVFLCLNNLVNTSLDKLLRICPCRVSWWFDIWWLSRKSSCPSLWEWGIRWTCFNSVIWRVCVVHRWESVFFSSEKHCQILRGLVWFWESKCFCWADWVCGF